MFSGCVFVGVTVTFAVSFWVTLLGEAELFLDEPIDVTSQTAVDRLSTPDQVTVPFV